SYYHSSARHAHATRSEPISLPDALPIFLRERAGRRDDPEPDAREPADAPAARGAVDARRTAGPHGRQVPAVRRASTAPRAAGASIGRTHVCNPVTRSNRMAVSAVKNVMY